MARGGLQARSAPDAGWYVAAVAAVYGLAVLVRVWRWLSSYISGDGAVCGLLGTGVLEGRWPLFFWGQDFMGALDGYLAAPVYALWGASTLTLNIWAPLLSLGSMALLHLCLRPFFSRAAVLLALAYMALPPALAIFHAGKPNNHYPLGLFLCALLMWLSLRLWRSQRWDLLLPLGWGLTAGLALWTNLQSLSPVAACFILLLVTCLPRMRLPSLLAMALGLAAGAAPLIYYNLSHGWGYVSQVEFISLQYVSGHLGLWFYNAFPLILGFNTPIAKGLTAPWTPLFLLYLLVAALAVWGAALLLWRARQKEQRWLLLPLLILAGLLAILLVSIYGKELFDWDLRYALPVFLALPFCWAALAEFMERRKKWLIAGLAIGLLTLNLAGWPGFWGGFLFDYGDTYRTQKEPPLLNDIAGLRRAGFSHLYSGDSDVYAFLAEGKPIFSDPWRDRRLHAALVVDAQINAGFFNLATDGFKFLGLDFKTSPPGVSHSFAQPKGVERLLPRKGWRAKTLRGVELGRALNDGDLATGLELTGGAKAGNGLVLDLGRSENLAGLALLPADFRHMPLGLRVEAAGVDGKFQLIREVENYWGPFYVSGPHPMIKARYPRMECYFPPREIRYLRITHLGPGSRHPWTVQEILLWGPGTGPPPPDWQASGEALLNALEQAKAKRLYADAWPSALAATRLGNKLRTVSGNFATNDYGYLTPSPYLPLALDPSPGNALAVLGREGEATARALGRAGINFHRQKAGRFDIFFLGGRSPRPRPLHIASVSSPLLPKLAAELALGRPQGGRWTSLKPQRPGMELSIDLGRPRRVEWVVLSFPDHPQDYPRGLAIEVSADGRDWLGAPHVAASPLSFSGHLPLAAPMGRCEYRLNPPVRTRHLRLVLTTFQADWFWSVQELEVLGN
jgi:hypothetical protein